MFGGTFFVYWRGYAVSFRAGVHRDAGMVPLSLQVTAKGENKTTQLAALRQVSSFLQRILLRAKRHQIPGSRRPSPEAHRWDVAEIALVRGASLRDAADVCSRGAHR